LNGPFDLTLNVHNSHPASPAADLSISAETADPFVFVGARNAVMPQIEPGAERTVGMTMVAVGGTAWFALPTVRLWQGRGDERREIRIEERETGRQGSMVFVRP